MMKIYTCEMKNENQLIFLFRNKLQRHNIKKRECFMHFNPTLCILCAFIICISIATKILKRGFVDMEKWKISSLSIFLWCASKGFHLNLIRSFNPNQAFRSVTGKSNNCCLHNSTNKSIIFEFDPLNSFHLTWFIMTWIGDHMYLNKSCLSE